MPAVMTVQNLLRTLDILDVNAGACSADGWLASDRAASLHSLNPTDDSSIAAVVPATRDDYDAVVRSAVAAFPAWRAMPAPRRGEIVRDLGNALRALKEPLGDLVSLEMGKIRAEGHGEVQEMIDICDFAVGLSRQLYGLTMHSERPGHRMYEQWHPLGAIGVISAFNFPVAVWSWNAALAAV
jgi:aldehyde dehydrogenase (NAD+)